MACAGGSNRREVHRVLLMTETVYLSREGLERLRSELEHLMMEVRPQATEQLARAREHGDLSENAEFDAARENLTKITRRISDLQRKLSKVEIIEEHKIEKDEVRILSRVTLENVSDGSKADYTIVDPLQSDPRKRFISVKSPIGKGLLGKRVGDEVRVAIPTGEIHFRVLSIERSTGL